MIISGRSETGDRRIGSFASTEISPVRGPRTEAIRFALSIGFEPSTYKSALRAGVCRLRMARIMVEK